MKLYINTETLEYPVSEQDIKALHPNTSFAKPFVAPAPFAPVAAVDRPASMVDEQVYEGEPTFIGTGFDSTINRTVGYWVQTWLTKKLSAEVIEARKARHLVEIRRMRDEKLRASDWIVSISDSPLSAEKTAEWVEYRKALRDMTNVADPFDIEWPTPPQA